MGMVTLLEIGFVTLLLVRISLYSPTPAGPAAEVGLVGLVVASVMAVVVPAVLYRAHRWRRLYVPGAWKATWLRLVSADSGIAAMRCMSGQLMACPSTMRMFILGASAEGCWLAHLALERLIIKCARSGRVRMDRGAGRSP